MTKSKYALTKPTFLVQNVSRGSSPTADKQYLEKLIKTNQERLFEMLWYIQYQVPFSQRENRSDDGLRALLLPPSKNFLPTVPVMVESEPDTHLSVFHFWNRYLAPQLQEAKYMLETIKSMYRNQQKRNEGGDLGKITFYVKLTERNYVAKLNYIAYTFPDHPSLVYDYICPNCGQIITYNFVVDPVPVCNCE